MDCGPTEISCWSPERSAIPYERFSDAVFCFVVVCGLFSLSNEGVHALVCSEETVHAHDGFEREDALHECHHVHEARGADHGLVGEDGLHGLLHAVVGLQRRQERLDFFPDPTASEHAGVHQVRANQRGFNAILLSSL